MEPDLKHLSEMLVGFKGLPMAGKRASDLKEYSHLRDVVEMAGLANLTALMASVRAYVAVVKKNKENINAVSFFSFLQVMPDCSSYLLKCWWQGHPVDNCTDIFQIRKTNDGFCCSFNALKQSENVDL